MSELDSVFKELKVVKLCKSQYAFSRDFLGKSPSYMSHIKATNKKPSVESLMVLHLKLSELVLHSKEPTDIASYRAKDCLITLSNKVLSEIKERCRS
ncbi:MAG: hypothetical protein MJK15_02905 [Colwellia sp.]|nr:hypothetical protein [Colwellia sp.]